MKDINFEELERLISIGIKSKTIAKVYDMKHNDLIEYVRENMPSLFIKLMSNDRS